MFMFKSIKNLSTKLWLKVIIPIVITVISIIVGIILACCGISLYWFILPLFWIPYFSITIGIVVCLSDIWNNIEVYSKKINKE